MIAAGFEQEYNEVTNEKFLVFPTLAMLAIDEKKKSKNSKEPIRPNQSTYIKHLQESLSWLETTMIFCQEYLKEKLGQEIISNECEQHPSDIIIRLELPHGKKIQGGFMMTDTLQDIKQFACSFFQPDK